MSLYNVNDWRAYRILSPHLLFSLALLTACRRAVVTYVLTARSLIFGQNFALRYNDFHRGHCTGKNNAASAFSADYGSELRAPHDVSPWGNSLLIGDEGYQPFLTDLSAGIGINCALDWDRICYSLKSAYVIIPPEVYRHIVGKVRLQPVKSGRFGALFINLYSPLHNIK